MRDFRTRVRYNETTPRRCANTVDPRGLAAIKERLMRIIVPAHRAAQLSTFGGAV